MFMHIVVCIYTQAHLSVCMGVRLPSCVCMHVVSYLTPDVLTQHFQVMFTFVQLDLSMRPHSPWNQ